MKQELSTVAIDLAKKIGETPKAGQLGVGQVR